MEGNSREVGLPCILPPVTLSVVIITYNEEANLGRTLESVRPLVSGGKGEVIVVDSGSTDRTVEIAKSLGAKVFIEEWKGYAAQKNSAIAKASGDWVLSLDADEEVDHDLQKALSEMLESLDLAEILGRQPDAHPLTREDAEAEYHIGAKLDSNFAGLWIPRKNEFLGRRINHGGFWPDSKLRFFRHGAGAFGESPVHETVAVKGTTGRIRYGALLHHSYPTLSDYIEHMNRYSSLGAEMAVAKGHRGFSLINIVARPFLTFTYNYFFRLGFLDGREGLLLHLYHAVYVSWKYAKAWEIGRGETLRSRVSTSAK
jgi:glycosyltransferase involved in cell wall biosynthesis